MSNQTKALNEAARKFDLLPKHGRPRTYAPRFMTRYYRGLGESHRTSRSAWTKHQFRVKVKSCDGTRENERELAGRLNRLRNRIAEAA